MENINTALTLLAVGMGTVFLILLFIIYFSTFLIKIINKYIPEQVKEKTLKTTRNIITVQPKIIAAISTAINVASGGQMKVSKIEKK